jgi:hypothetical protein
VLGDTLGPPWRQVQLGEALGTALGEALRTRAGFPVGCFPLHCRRDSGRSWESCLAATRRRTHTRRFLGVELGALGRKRAGELGGAGCGTWDNLLGEELGPELGEALRDRAGARLGATLGGTVLGAPQTGMGSTRSSTGSALQSALGQHWGNTRSSTGSCWVQH